jgi:hypothetical protein
MDIVIKDVKVRTGSMAQVRVQWRTVVKKVMNFRAT